jgi:hypothetical protein
MKYTHTHPHVYYSSGTTCLCEKKKGKWEESGPWIGTEGSCGFDSALVSEGGKDGIFFCRPVVAYTRVYNASIVRVAEGWSASTDGKGMIVAREGLIFLFFNTFLFFSVRYVSLSCARYLCTQAHTDGRTDVHCIHVSDRPSVNKFGFLGDDQWASALKRKDRVEKKETALTCKTPR